MWKLICANRELIFYSLEMKTSIENRKLFPNFLLRVICVVFQALLQPADLGITIIFKSQCDKGISICLRVFL